MLPVATGMGATVVEDEPKERALAATFAREQRSTACDSRMCSRPSEQQGNRDGMCSVMAHRVVGLVRPSDGRSGAREVPVQIVRRGVKIA
jgi:hypothetical protein